MLTHFYSWSAWRDIYEPKCHWNIVRTSDQKNIIGIWKYILHGHITDTLFSYSVMSNSLSPHGLQHTRLLCPSPSPRACSNSCPLNQWCHPTISSSVISSPPAFNIYGFPDSSIGKNSACNAGNPGSTPGSGRSTGEEIGYPLQYSWASLVAQLVKNPPEMWETWVRSLGWEDTLEKGTATHSSILVWRIPWTL